MNLIPKKLNAKLLGTLFSYFCRGLLLIAPFALTIYIITLAWNWIDSLIGLHNSGLRAILVVSSITFFGYLGSTLLIRSVFDLTEGLIARLPLVSIIYTSLKELMDAFVGNKKKFDKPVLVTFSREEKLYRLGFVTQHDLTGMHLPGSVAVYIPHSYNFSGDLFIVSKGAITPMDISSAEITKFVISGGVAGLQCLKEPQDQ